MGLCCNIICCMVIVWMFMWFYIGCANLGYIEVNYPTKIDVYVGKLAWPHVVTSLESWLVRGITYPNIALFQVSKLSDFAYMLYGFTDIIYDGIICETLFDMICRFSGRNEQHGIQYWFNQLNELWRYLLFSYMQKVENPRYVPGILY